MEAISARLRQLDEEIGILGNEIKAAKADLKAAAPDDKQMFKDMYKDLVAKEKTLLASRAKLEDQLSAAAAGASSGAAAVTGAGSTADAFMDRYQKHAPSSYDYKTWAAEQALDRHTLSQQNKEPLFLCHRPAWAPGMAASLVHPVFGKFLEDVQDNSLPLRRDTNFAAEFCYNALLTFDKEKTRQMTLAGLLDAYLGISTKAFDFSDFGMDGYIGHRAEPVTWCCAIIEYENELGATRADKYFQGQGYYSRICTQNSATVARQLSSFPSFLVEIQGPYMRVSGMGYLDRVHASPLTPHIMLAILPDAGQRSVLMSTLCALRRGVKNLQLFYEDLINHQAVARSPTLSLPAPWPFWMDCGVHQYSDRLTQIAGIKPWSVYSASFGGDPVIIKFSQRYSQAVHKAWAAADLAPRLLICDQLPGGWFFVVMERLDLSWAPLSLLDGQSQTEARQAAEQALRQAHLLDVFGPQQRSVHGDARDPNVMVTKRAMSTSSASAIGVKFIDFDWAGQHGVDRYPLFMSHAISWPEGAADQLVMIQQHDVELLQRGQPTAAAGYQWRSESG